MRPLITTEKHDMNSTDLLENLLGLYASPLDWARAALADEHNAEVFLDSVGTYDSRAYLLDVERACCFTFVEFDCGVAAIYHG
jgi:hypothetical protein